MKARRTFVVIGEVWLLLLSDYVRLVAVYRIALQQRAHAEAAADPEPKGIRRQPMRLVARLQALV